MRRLTALCRHSRVGGNPAFNVGGVQRSPGERLTPCPQCRALTRARPFLLILASIAHPTPSARNRRWRRTCGNANKACGATGGQPGLAISGALRSAGFGVARAARFVNMLAASCLSAASKASETSYAAHPEGEHRKAVGAQRRTPQHEPDPAGRLARAHTKPEGLDSRLRGNDGGGWNDGYAPHASAWARRTRRSGQPPKRLLQVRPLQRTPTVPQRPQGQGQGPVTLTAGPQWAR